VLLATLYGASAAEGEAPDKLRARLRQLVRDTNQRLRQGGDVHYRISRRVRRSTSESRLSLRLILPPYFAGLV
jgi:ElaB/YqjD/DUF883 family membrane-anchored ribosome-binding protein